MDERHDELDRRRALARLATALELPGGFAGLSATVRLRTLMEMRDPGKVLRHLRPDELYFLLGGIGLEDAGSLLPYTTPEQRTALRDLDAWSGWEFLPERFDRLLQLAQETSTDFAQRLVAETEPEVRALRLVRTARVVLTIDAEDEDLPDWTFPTPDGVFQIACEESDQVPATRRFLDLLYAEDIEKAHELLHAILRETVPSLEEQAFHARDARLQDLGFPSEPERFSLYEPFDADALKARIRSGAGPLARPPHGERGMALVAAGTDPGLAFWDALARASGRADTGEVALGLMLLVNRVLGSRTRDFFEPDAWEAAAAHAVCLVSLGLEDVSCGDRETAAEVLLRATPTELYRAGMEVLRPAHVRARQVVGDLGGMEHLRLLGTDEAEAVKAVAAFPPRFWGALSGGTLAARDFRTLAEVGLANRATVEARAVVAFARKVLGFDPRKAPEGTRAAVAPTFANVLATAWAHRVLSGTPSLAPLTGADLQALRVAAFEGDRLRPALRAARPDWPGASDLDREALQGYLDRALDAVQEALSGLDPSVEPDPRFVGEGLLHV